MQKKRKKRMTKQLVIRVPVGLYRQVRLLARLHTMPVGAYVRETVASVVAALALAAQAAKADAKDKYQASGR